MGRIVLDSASGDGHLNAKSLMIETSRRLGNGARVSLRVDSIASFSVFPGQVLGFQGINASGQYFNVSKILNLPSPPMLASSIQDLTDIHSQLNGQDVSCILASGPYTTDHNLNFDAFDELVRVMVEEKPDFAIFVRPNFYLEPC